MKNARRNDELLPSNSRRLNIVSFLFETVNLIPNPIYLIWGFFFFIINMNSIASAFK